MTADESEVSGVVGFDIPIDVLVLIVISFKVDFCLSDIYETKKKIINFTYSV